MTELRISDPAPDFCLPDAHDALVSMKDYAGRKLIIYFYPAALTPGCTTQAVDFSHDAADFGQAGYSIVGISPDSPSKLDTFMTQNSLHLTLLSDPSKVTITAYGAWGERVIYGKQITGVRRSTFVIAVDADGQGTIINAYYDVRATGHVARLRDRLGI